jgi:hypothetical protein
VHKNVEHERRPEKAVGRNVEQKKETGGEVCVAWEGRKHSLKLGSETLCKSETAPRSLPSRVPMGASSCGHDPLLPQFLLVKGINRNVRIAAARGSLICTIIWHMFPSILD